MHRRRTVCWLFVAFLLSAAGAWAQVPDVRDPILQPIVDEFNRQSSVWSGGIKTAAYSLFWGLVAIDFAWTLIMALLKQTDFAEVIAEMIRRIFFYGLFLALLNYSGDWSLAIVNSFYRLGSEGVTAAVAGVPVPTGGFYIGGGLSPDDIIKHGLNLAFRITDQMPHGLLSLMVAWIYGFTALVIIVFFGIIAAREVMILAEMYICLNAGVILLGFGGMRWTKDYAVNYYRYCISVGVKMMFIQLSLAVTLSILNHLGLAATAFDVRALLILLAAIAICVILVWSAPNIATQFLQGVSYTSGHELMSAAKVMATAAQTMATAATGGGAAIMNAVKLANAQQAAAKAAAAPTGGERLAGLFRTGAGVGEKPKQGGLANGMRRGLGAAMSTAKLAGKNLGKATLEGALTSASTGGSMGQAVNKQLMDAHEKLTNPEKRNNS